MESVHIDLEALSIPIPPDVLAAEKLREVAASFETDQAFDRFIDRLADVDENITEQDFADAGAAAASARVIRERRDRTWLRIDEALSKRESAAWVSARPEIETLLKPMIETAGKKAVAAYKTFGANPPDVLDSTLMRPAVVSAFVGLAEARDTFDRAARIVPVLAGRKVIPKDVIDRVMLTGVVPETLPPTSPGRWVPIPEITPENVGDLLAARDGWEMIVAGFSAWTLNSEVDAAQAVAAARAEVADRVRAAEVAERQRQNRESSAETVALLKKLSPST